MTHSERSRISGRKARNQSEAGRIGGKKKHAADPNYFRRLAALRWEPLKAGKQRVAAWLKTRPIGSCG